MSPKRFKMVYFMNLNHFETRCEINDLKMGKSQDFAYKWKRMKIDIAHRKKVIRIRFSIFSKIKAK